MRKTGIFRRKTRCQNMDKKALLSCIFALLSCKISKKSEKNLVKCPDSSVPPMRSPSAVVGGKNPSLDKVPGGRRAEKACPYFPGSIPLAGIIWNIFRRLFSKFFPENLFFSENFPALIPHRRRCTVMTGGKEQQGFDKGQDTKQKYDIYSGGS
jgi:hypothetical protein